MPPLLMRHVLIYLNLVANWHFSRRRGLGISTKKELMRVGLHLCYVLNTSTIMQGLTTEKNNNREGLQFLRPKEQEDYRFYPEYILIFFFLLFFRIRLKTFNHFLSFLQQGCLSILSCLSLPLYSPHKLETLGLYFNF